MSFKRRDRDPYCAPEAREADVVVAGSDRGWCSGPGPGPGLRKRRGVVPAEDRFVGRDVGLLRRGVGHGVLGGTGSAWSPSPSPLAQVRKPCAFTSAFLVEALVGHRRGPLEGRRGVRARSLRDPSHRLREVGVRQVRARWRVDDADSCARSRRASVLRARPPRSIAEPGDPAWSAIRRRNRRCVKASTDCDRGFEVPAAVAVDEQCRAMPR